MHSLTSPSGRCLSLLALLVLTTTALPFTHAAPPDADDDLFTLTAAPLTLAHVRALYGEPSQRVGADLWIYWNFPTAHLDAQRAGFDTLIVHSVGDSARTIKLVRGADLRALLRQLGQTKRVATAPPSAQSTRG